VRRPALVLVSWALLPSYDFFFQASVSLYSFLALGEIFLIPSLSFALPFLPAGRNEREGSPPNSGPLSDY